MVSIGNSVLPGVSTTVESATSTGINSGAAAQIGLVGQADLITGAADPNTVYEVRTPVRARELFGAGSMLAENIVDALTEGAYPVHAVATTEVSVTNEDISSISGTSGTLSTVPVIQSPSDVVFTIDGTVKTSVVTYEDPSTATVGTDEVYYNPVTGDFEVDVSPAASADVDYTAYDYVAAVGAMESGAAERIDLFGVLTEDPTAVSAAHDAVRRMESAYNFAMVVAGASVHISDFSAYSNSYDSSRIQQLYPARDDEGHSVVGSYLGLRAALGISNSPIFKRLPSQPRLAETLSPDDQELLVQNKVVPLADESRGARVVEDLTSVDDQNTEEDNMRQGLHRLVVDYTTEVVNEVSESFIGELHTQPARNALRTNIVARLGGLQDLNAITGFVVTVEEVDAMTASVDVGIDTIDPLRNITATVTAGQVQQASA